MHRFLKANLKKKRERKERKKEEENQIQKFSRSFLHRLRNSRNNFSREFYRRMKICRVYLV